MKFKKLLVSVVVLAGAALTMTTMQNSVKADTTAKSENAVQTKPMQGVKNRPDLTKKGYILRVINDKYADKIYVGKKNYSKSLKSFELKGVKTVSAKKVQNVKFRVEKEFDYSKRHTGAPVFLLASKDKNYFIWTTQSGLQYFYLNNKNMRGVKKALTKIANSDNRQVKKGKNKKQLDLAFKAAKKLRGKQKKFVVSSLKELKKDGTMDIEGSNLLLFGF
ncbi:MULTISPECIES: hypothetical protein [Lactobacillus]|uniref:Uncharacterized protein n=1 Tax=Lactobacillus xujianguonis TaxID=2495899 RepID=A0A437SXC7_9LACO|nr:MULTISPECIES: hypothetical protein [Lactobacillus]RVU71520.1 hypothetical protein EJK17_02125 [Lactobacillus xujianguonis]RVU76707.1 hypothetical protein EJK20_04285 [Lactobacillus xujianguonis]